jgi:predicted O-methyltransferase YrrM
VSLFHRSKAHLRHWLLEVDEHSIHSPFFFDFYTKVLKTAPNNDSFAKLEKLRTDLLSNSSKLTIEPAGSKTNARSLSEITHQSVLPQHFSALFYRIIKHLKAKKIVELGTSVGLTTLYLAEPPQATVYTFEANHTLANVALTNFEYLDKKNVTLIEGEIETSLSDFLQETGKANFVLVDANHTYEGTLKYFNLLMKRIDEKSVIVVNDIHRSPEMELAWQWLTANELVYGSIDLLQCGILFFEPSLNKQHFVFSLGKN